MPNASPERVSATIDMRSPKLPVRVVVIGVVSMLNDIATDMVTPLIPILLAGSMASGAVALGLVEGAANAVAAALRLWAGRHSDLSGGRRKPLVIAGYSLSCLVRPTLALASQAWHVLLLRAIDRVGKGLRSAPRDALLVDLTPAPLRARAFGLHSAFDNFGAVCGALIGAGVVAAWAFDVRDIVLLSVVPGVLAIAVFAWGVREPVRPAVMADVPPRLRWSDVPIPLRGYLMVVMLFTFARTAELFVILRAHELGASLAQALLMWATFNFIKIFANLGAGVLADRYGRARLLIPGWILHSVALFGLACAESLGGLWLGVLFFGFALSVGEGVERTVIGDHAPLEQRGTLYGWYYALVGVVSIPAGLLIGWIWQQHGAAVGWTAAGLIGLLATLILQVRVAPRLQHLT